MRLNLLNQLATTLDKIPVRAIFKTLELESHMLREDLLKGRPVSISEAQSVLEFYEFIRSVKEGAPARKSAFAGPIHHVPFYRKIVDRLVEAQELPVTAKTQFETTFAEGPLALIKGREH
jgi:hypothetical protein